MAVSFLSKNLNTLPYVSPIDQNLVFGAMLHKQQQFDKGVQQVDSLLQNLGSYTILNPGHREYYQQKMTDLTNQVNQLGGADFSDRNTLQQIGGLSQSITMDPRIRQALQDTQQIRQHKATNDAWKMDPKKYGDIWRPQNEDDLMNHINAYMQDTTPEATYKGTLTPFTDVDKAFNTRMQQVVTQIQKNKGYTSSDGHYFTSVSELTMPHIRNIIQSELALNPQYANQLRINANYQYKNIPENQLRSGRNTQLQMNGKIIEAELKQVNEQLALPIATSTDAKRKELESQRDQLVVGLKAAQDKYKTDAANLGKYSAEQLRSQIYNDDMLAGLQNQYAFRNVDVKYDPTFGANLIDNRLRQFEQTRHGEWAVTTQQGQHEFESTLQFNYAALNLKAQQAEREATSKAAKDLGGMYYNPDDHSYSILDPQSLYTQQTGSETQNSNISLYGNQLKTNMDMQNSNIRLILKDLISQTDANKASQLDKFSRQLMDPKDPNLAVGEKYDTQGPNKFTPEEVRTIGKVYSLYYNLMHNNPVDPHFVDQLSSTGKKAFRDIQAGALLHKIYSQQYHEKISQAQKLTGMSDSQLQRMTQLENEKINNPQSFETQYSNQFGQAPVKTSNQRELDALQEKYKKVKNVDLNDPLAKQGSFQNEFLVIGAEHYKRDSNLQTLLHSAIMQNRIGADHKDNATVVEDNKKLMSADFKNIKINPNTGIVSFDAVVGGTNKDEDGNSKTAIPLGHYSVNLAGTPEIMQLIPHSMQNPLSIGQEALRGELQRTGQLAVNGKAVPFNLTNSRMPMIGFTVQKDVSGRGYRLGYYYGSQNRLIPNYIHGRGSDSTKTPFVPQSFQQDPTGFLNSGLESWFEQVMPILQTRYGNGDPMYKPSIDDFYHLLEDPAYQH